MKRLLLFWTLIILFSSAHPDAQRKLRFLYRGETETDLCSFPNFPNNDASCVGVPAGTSLTTYSGGGTISTPTTIDSKIITTCLEFTSGAKGSILRNSTVTCNEGGGPIYIDDKNNYSVTNGGTEPIVTIENNEISCDCVGNCVGISEAHFVARRNLITNCENGLSGQQNWLVEDNYIHALFSSGGGAHEDGIELSCAYWNGTGPGATACSGSLGAGWNLGTRNITVRHNAIVGRSGSGDTADGTSAIITNHDGITDPTLIVDKNLLCCGSFTLYCNRPEAGGQTVTDNRFWTLYHATVGAFGPSDDCADENISGNVYYPSGAPITLAYLFKSPWNRFALIRMLNIQDRYRI